MGSLPPMICPEIQMPTICRIRLGKWIGLGMVIVYSAFPGFAQPAPDAVVKWELPIGCVSDSSPAVADDGTIYFGTWKGGLWAVSPDGHRRWTFEAGSEIKSAPAIGKVGDIYFGSRDRWVYALKSDGKLRWKFLTGGWVDASPALASDGTVCVGSWDGSFYALSPNGQKKWTFKTGGPIVSSAAIGKSGTVFFGSHDGCLYALTSAGEKRWEYPTGGPVLSSPALGADGAVFFTSVQGWLYALNEDGSLRWRLRTLSPTESSPVLGPDGNIYLGVNRELWAVSPAGQKLWAKRDEEMIDAAPMMLSDQSVCYVSRYGMLQAVRCQEEGKQLNWKFYLYGHEASSPGIGRDGSIYVGGKWTNMYALDFQVPLAKSPWPKFRGNARNTGNAADER